MLGQIESVDPRFLHQGTILLVAALALLASLGSAGAAWYSALKRKGRVAVDQPVEVSGTVRTETGQGWVSADHCNLMHQGMREQIQAISVEVKSIKPEMDEKLSDLYDRLNTLGREVSGLTATLHQINLQIANILAQLQERNR